MADKIQTIIPRYGELNRIYRDYIDNHASNRFVCVVSRDRKVKKAKLLRRKMERRNGSLLDKITRTEKEALKLTDVCHFIMVIVYML